MSAETACAEARNKLKKVVEVYTKLSGSKKAAIDGFIRVRDDASKEAKEDFIARMRDKGHIADIEFAHGGARGHADLRDLEIGDGEIRLRCTMDGIARGADAKKVKTEGRSQASHSGGEKSYTGNALLSSIARVAAAPFRIVDEFDVFQDEKTRADTLKSLLRDAQQVLPGAAPDGGGALAQYILLTPHDISSVVKPSEHVKVHRLPDPRPEGR